MTPTVSGLFVYPLKSAGGIALDTATLDDFGIRWDRRWMVIDADGRFVTQRTDPRMALIRPRIGDALTLSAPGLETLSLPLAMDGAPAPVVVWHDETRAIDCGDEAAAWISRILRYAARIVFMPGDVVRPVQRDFGRTGDRVSFADAFPLLLITQASLDALNDRLDEPLPMNRFRPNVVVAHTAPHAEDAWRRISIGDVPCRVVKACARCVTTTVDQDTARQGREPLRTLAGYRRRDGLVFFGMNAIHDHPGTVRVGDAVVPG